MEKVIATQEELDEIRLHNNKVIDQLLELGDIESSLSRLEKKKTATIYHLESNRKELRDAQSKLVDKYGKENLDLKTGEIT